VDLAVAVIIGGAFGKIVSSLVGDIINPLIGSIVGQPDFGGIVFHAGSGVIKVGNFLNNVIEFALVAGVIYFIFVLPMNHFLARMKGPDAVTSKPCPECLSEIPLAAKRCAHCAQPVA
jgi:large conductance mechanosensitive channel